MSPRSQPTAQIDAFATAHAPDAPARRPSPERLPEPALAALACDASELWLAMHLPQLAASAETHLAPGEAHRRRRLLERLAMAAQTYTPRVSLAPPDGLLLEIRGSLQLFCGAQRICRLIAEAHRAAGVTSVLAVAPTPLAALACARAHQETRIVERARLRGSVMSLPLASLRWPAQVIARLAKIGVYTAGQALRLPRAGFARRFGAPQLASLDRLTGRSADPRLRFQPRERFRRLRDLSYEIEHHEALLRALRPLLEEMASFLRARQAGITRLECRFRHRNAAPTVCVLHLNAPAADAQRLATLLGERLSTIVLPEPVRACALRTDIAVPLSPVCDSLWQPGEHGGGGTVEGTQLIEQLRARLSAHAVHGLRLTSDHRPEQASRIVEPLMLPEALTVGGANQVRPLWLLPAPQPLSERAGLPWYHGSLELGPLTRKERIEAASWDTQGIARDYYVGVDARGIRLWIFRERARPHRWFLHGMFG